MRRKLFLYRFYYNEFMYQQLISWRGVFACWKCVLVHGHTGMFHVWRYCAVVIHVWSTTHLQTTGMSSRYVSSMNIPYCRDSGMIDDASLNFRYEYCRDSSMINDASLNYRYEFRVCFYVSSMNIAYCRDSSMIDDASLHFGNEFGVWLLVRRGEGFNRWACVHLLGHRIWTFQPVAVMCSMERIQRQQ